MRLLAEYNIDLNGKRAVVLGRSILVGKPLALMLLEANATVTIAHSRSQDLAALTREADVLPEVISIVTANWRHSPATIDHGSAVPLPERPVFDLYGGRDRALREAGQRRATSWNHSNWYTSWELGIANVDFSGCEEQFAGRVRGWLARVDKLLPPS